jgi:hypothetical protein
LSLLAVAAVGAGVAVGLLQDRGRSPGPDPSASPTETAPEVPRRTTLLSVASTADASRVLAIPALLISEPTTGGDASVLVIDGAMRAIGPAGAAPLRQHASGFGPEGLAGAIRNELGLRIDTAVEITEPQLADVLERTGRLDVTVAAPIEEDDTTIYEAGIHRMHATELVTFLAFPFDDPSIAATTRIAMLVEAWRAIGTAPATDAAVRNAGLAADATSALDALARMASIEAIPIREIEGRIVLDELTYDATVPQHEAIWLSDAAPGSRPQVELRGQTLVEPMLLLIADGIRIVRVKVEAVDALVIEADDLVFGARIVELLGGGTMEAPEEPLRTGLDARIAFPRAA